VRLIIGADPAAAASLAADESARACRAAAALRGLAVIAVSGGETPWLMLRELRGKDLPWERIHVAQVDERCAARGDPQRNLTRLEEILVRDGPLPASNLWPMPVEAADRILAAAEYQSALESRFGQPLRFDLVQLGLGTDGHTASLVPGDPVLEVMDRDVAVTAPYQGLPRMTLTYPVLARARERLWLVTGDAKAARLADLLSGTGGAPAIRVARDHATVVADAASAASPAPSGSAPPPATGGRGLR
jgi:6-phosphogluconolactonase